MVFIVNFASIPFLSTLPLRLPRLERKAWTVEGVKGAIVTQILEDIGKESSTIWLTFLNEVIQVVEGQAKDPELETLVIRHGLLTIVQR